MTTTTDAATTEDVPVQLDFGDLACGDCGQIVAGPIDGQPSAGMTRPAWPCPEAA